jgi:catechol 2,3-dioxygenase-like lactoylglutathione lyase family enzyme
MIDDISHVALQVPDVDASVEFAVTTLGMIEVARIGTRAYLTHASPYPSLGDACSHHVLEYVAGPHAGLDHVGLLVRDSDVLGRIRTRARAAGAVVVSDEVQEPGLHEALRIAAPSGHIFEVHTEMESVSRSYVPRGLMPRRLGHVNCLSPDVRGFMRFLVDAFGLSISDWTGPADQPRAGFARCHFDHHTLGVIRGPVEGMHHLAFETVSAAEIGQLGDHLARAGERYVWGPGRHGPGDNIAAYLTGPDGIMIEIYADMHRIIGEGWTPRFWSTDDLGLLNVWSVPVGDEPLRTIRTPLSVVSGVPQ